MQKLNATNPANSIEYLRVPSHLIIADHRFPHNDPIPRWFSATRAESMERIPRRPLTLDPSSLIQRNRRINHDWKVNFVAPSMPRARYAKAKTLETGRIRRGGERRGAEKKYSTRSSGCSDGLSNVGLWHWKIGSCYWLSSPYDSSRRWSRCNSVPRVSSKIG